MTGEQKAVFVQALETQAAMLHEQFSAEWLRRETAWKKRVAREEAAQVSVSTERPPDPREDAPEEAPLEDTTVDEIRRPPPREPGGSIYKPPTEPPRTALPAQPEVTADEMLAAHRARLAGQLPQQQPQAGLTAADVERIIDARLANAVLPGHNPHVSAPLPNGGFPGAGHAVDIPGRPLSRWVYRR